MQKHLSKAAILSVFLVGCATSPPPTPTPVEQDLSTITTLEEDHAVTAQTYLDYAADAEQLQSLDYLVYASEQFANEENYHKALWLALQTDVLIDEASANADYQSEEQQLKFEIAHYRLALVKATSLVSMQEFTRASKSLDTANEIATTYSLQHLSHYYYLENQVQLEQKRDVLALNAYLNAVALNEETDEQDIYTIWFELTQLTSWQVDQLEALSPPDFAPWKALILAAHKYGYDQDAFNTQLSKWQSEYPGHDANALIAHLSTPLSERPALFDKFESQQVEMPIDDLSNSNERIKLNF